MTEFKVGDTVKVLSASIDSALIGRILPIIKIEDDYIWLKGSIAKWSIKTQSLEKVSPPVTKTDELGAKALKIVKKEKEKAKKS